MAINLLSGSIAPKGHVIKLVKSINTFSTVLFVILLIIVAGSGGLYYYNYQKSVEIGRRISSLETEIKNLQATETKVVLLADRLKKISAVKSGSSSLNGVLFISNLVKLFPENVVLTDADVSTNGTKLSLIVPTTAEIENLSSAIVAGSGYKNVIVTNISYSPERGGYLVDYDLKN